MKTHRFLVVAAALAGLLLTDTTLRAQGTIFTYQGRLNANGSPANGIYDFRFRLAVDSLGTTFIGSPIVSNAMVVSNGLFTAPLNFGAVFTGSNYWLQVDVKTNLAGSYTALTPAQPLTPAPYAMMAGVASNLLGTLPAAQLSGTVGTSQLLDGAITSAKILDGTIVGADLANNTITGAQLADNIDLGTISVPGQLNVYRTAANTPAISLFGSASQISTYGSDGVEQIRLWGTTYGELLLYDSSTNNHTAVRLTAFGTSGGFLNLNQGNSSSAGLNIFGDSIGGSRLMVYNTSNSLSMDLRAQYDSTTPAAWADFYDDGSERVTITARNGSTGRGGLVDVKNDNALNTIRLIGDTGSGDSRLEMYAGGTNLSFQINADDSASGSSVYLFNGSGQTRVEIDSDDGDNGAVIRMYKAAGGVGLFLDAEASNAGYLAVYGTNSTQNIILDGRDPNGKGRVTCDVLQADELLGSGGVVGIGRTATANTLEVEGNASKTTAGSWLANSDARIKTDIETVHGALDALDKVHLVSFRYTPEYQRAHPSVENRRYLNVVAQEFREVFPDDVKSSGEKMPDGSEILQVDTYPLTIYAAAAVQELNQKLTGELKQKQTEIAELKQRLDKLERILNEKN